MRNRHRRGNAILEFAIIASVMTAVLFAVLDFSRVFYYAEIASGAARAGSQFALLSSANAGNTAGMEAAAESDAQANTTSAHLFTATATTFCQCANSTVNVTCAVSSCGAGQLWSYARVRTSLRYSSIFNYYLLPSTLTLQAASTVRVQ